ncbi:visual pigment-like receptor peropsin [Gigantopelta aegis]|uniref:visual pigment-like receptor peropsin n=1 Tax=Gigantopelta aegis TaxID=1735272 RepID=UPI001B889969|nr:visual pigment-like receptor peropsin [Gigantopelta aegis]
MDFFNVSMNMSELHDNLTNSSNERAGPSATALHVGATVMLFALMWGVFANVLTMIVILTERDLKNITNIFIVSLCINDILNLGINNLLVLVSYFMMTWATGSVVCEMVTHLSVLLMGSSLWHTGLVAIHRLIVVVFNPFYKKISKNAYTVFVLVFARVVPLLFLIQPSLGYMSQYEPKLLRCIIKKGFGLYTMFVSVALMMLPSLILIVCYIAIFVKVHHSSSAFRTSRKREWLRREIQITKMFGMVFLLIIIGYLPYGIVRSIDKGLNFSADFYVAITVFFAVANSCNPIIYGVMDRKIRRACFRALGLEERCLTAEEKSKMRKSSIKSNGESQAVSEARTEAVPLNSQTTKK